MLIQKKETPEAKLPLDVRIIALVQTQFYNFKDNDKDFIKEMRGVYIYDKNTVTHCCEITPSYYLIHLYDYVIFNDKGEALPDKERERLLDLYESRMFDDNPNQYVHCHVIDSLEEKLKAKQFRYRVYGSSGVAEEDVSKDDQMEALREHFNCNHPL